MCAAPAVERRTIHKVLVANRGEIAVRIMRTCVDMGLSTVAVFSEADEHAPFVRAADEAVCIGPPAPKDSYLRIDAIVEAALATGADAIHPGYGFASENAAFPRACDAAGLVFIGPSAEAMEVMGLKIRSKVRLEEAAASGGATADIPLIPGYHGEDQSVARLAAEAASVGLPLLIKASAGGGGKGMRVVRDMDDLEAAIASAKQEAESSFGNATLLIERYFENVRHIEFQVFGDAHGGVVHLGERECSLQRRHQKVIEESPSVALDYDLRRRMGESAKAIAQAVDYVGAGTVEFILDGDSGGYYFLEMNTRLQVEHPVTEMVTGLDLVRLQIEIAEGASLEELHICDALTHPLAKSAWVGGHAIECRLYAEDPAAGFRPCPGTVLRWDPAAPGPSVRYDSGVEDGSVVTSYYDPMLAKIIVHGTSRAEAIRKAIRAVSQTRALGLTTNQAFLANCLDHPAFAAGTFNTHFIEEVLMPELEAAAAAADGDGTGVAGVAVDLALAGLVFDWAMRAKARRHLRNIGAGWGNNARPRQERVLEVGGTVVRVAYAARKTRSRVVDGQVFDVAAVVTVADGPDGGEAVDHVVTLVACDGESATATCEVDGLRRDYAVVEGERVSEDGVELFVAAGSDRARVVIRPRFTATTAGTASGAGSGGYRAPTDCIIVEVCAEEGATVAAGDVLMVVLSMKMESKIVAAADGVVGEIFVQAGDHVAGGVVLVDLIPAGADGDVES